MERDIEAYKAAYARDAKKAREKEGRNIVCMTHLVDPVMDSLADFNTAIVMCSGALMLCDPEPRVKGWKHQVITKTVEVMKPSGFNRSTLLGLMLCFLVCRYNYLRFTNDISGAIARISSSLVDDKPDYGSDFHFWDLLLQAVATLALVLLTLRTCYIPELSNVYVRAPKELFQLVETSTKMTV